MAEFIQPSAPILSVSPHIRAEHVQSGLHPKFMGTAAGYPDDHWRCVLLTDGVGVVETDEDRIVLNAPCLAWFPWTAGRRLRIEAGGVGYHLALGGAIMTNAIGSNPESFDLRIFADRRVVTSMEGEAEVVSDAEHAFGLIVREIQRPSSGSWNLVLAQIRSILVYLWRLSGVEDMAARTQGEVSGILQRFRQLMEVRFQQRWRVAQYAEALGVTHDRLHDICRRELGKTPLGLIHERVIHEARLRLERSALTVEQVADSVGFRDVGQFSRFFRSKVGMPPATYRRAIARGNRDRSDEVEASRYSDWP